MCDQLSVLLKQKVCLQNQPSNQNHLYCSVCIHTVHLFHHSNLCPRKYTLLKLKKRNVNYVFKFYMFTLNKLNSRSIELFSRFDCFFKLHNHIKVKRLQSLVKTQSCFDVDTTSITLGQRRMNVKMTLFGSVIRNKITLLNKPPRMKIKKKNTYVIF